MTVTDAPSSVPPEPIPPAQHLLIDHLHKVAAGDRVAFSALYDATSRKLFGTVLRILKSQALAEEVLQEVYLKIWQRAADFDVDKASPISWMAAIARNRALDEIRKRTLATTDADSDLESMSDTMPGPAGLFEQGEKLRQMQHCMEEIEEPHCTMLQMAYLYGFSRQELAARFDKPLGTVKTWLHRSLKQLKDCLG